MVTLPGSDVYRGTWNTNAVCFVRPCDIDTSGAVWAYKPEGQDKYDKLPAWKPNQLRHTLATEVRKQFGLEAAQVVLGHAEANTTHIYAERDYDKAADAMRRIG